MIFYRYLARSNIISKSFRKISRIPYIKKLFKKETPKTLGRWKIHDSNDEKNIRATLANYDSCGDNLCGDPINLKGHIDYIKNKDSLEKFIVIGDDVIKVN